MNRLEKDSLNISKQMSSFTLCCHMEEKLVLSRLWPLFHHEGFLRLLVEISTVSEIVFIESNIHVKQNMN